MDTETRLLQLFEAGCPKCRQKDSFKVDSTELIRRTARPSVFGGVDYGDTDYIDTLSEDYILCGNFYCDWQEPEE